MKMRAGQYAQRLAVLNNLGFANYKEYLNSDLYQGIKSRVLTRRPYCELCGDVSVVVHHVAYNKKSLRGSKSPLLVSLCNSCHYYIEVDKAGEKTTWSMAVTKLLCKLASLNKHDRASVIARCVGRGYKPEYYSGSPYYADARLKYRQRYNSTRWRNKRGNKKKQKTGKIPVKGA